MSEIKVEYPEEYEELIKQYNLHNQTACGPECQRKRDIAKLRNNVEQTQFIKSNVDKELKNATRNYTIAAKGQQVWGQMVEENAEDAAAKLTSKYQTEFNELEDDISHSLASLKSQVQSMRQLKTVKDRYSSDTRNLNEVANQVKSIKDTNLRESVFHENTVDTIQLWRGYLSYVYWFIVILYVAVVMVIGQQFRYIRGWGFLALLVAYPYVTQYLATWIPSDWFITLDVKHPE